MRSTGWLVSIVTGMHLIACSTDADTVGTEASARTSSQDPAPGCPRTELAPGDHTFQVASANGLTYSYTLRVPEGIDPKARTAVLFHWHAGNSDPEEARSVVDIDAKAQDAGLIVVYPRSADKVWDIGTEQAHLVFGIRVRDEMVFVRELLRDVKSKVCVDERRIYSNGMSNGGMLSQAIACNLADEFAAVASTGGVLTVPPNACEPARPIPILLTSGTADAFAGYSQPSPLVGGVSSVDTVRAWVAANECTGEPETFVQKGQATCRRHTQCAGDAEVAYCVIEGMGHCIPGMRKESDSNCVTKDGVPLGMPNDDIDGTQVDLDFMLRFARP